MHPRSKVIIPYHNVLVLMHPGNDRNRIIGASKYPNLVPLCGRNLICNLLADKGCAPSSIALGTDISPTIDGVTTELGNEVWRNVFTARRVSGSTLTAEIFLSTAECNGFTLAEAGIFADERWHDGVVEVGGGTLFSRVVIVPIEKTSAVSLTFRWEIPISAG